MNFLAFLWLLIIEIRLISRVIIIKLNIRKFGSEPINIVINIYCDPIKIFIIQWTLFFFILYTFFIILKWIFRFAIVVNGSVFLFENWRINQTNSLCIRIGIILRLYSKSSFKNIVGIIFIKRLIECILTLILLYFYWLLPL